jgi:NAD(P)-dependent dehydrogenase (short-subunit alcohol dehydrogenase family)
VTAASFHINLRAGIIGMTDNWRWRAASMEFARNRFQIETNQTREQLKDPEWAGYMLGKTVLGRLGRPEEVAEVGLFPGSDDSSYVTGVDIVVDRE